MALGYTLWLSILFFHERQHRFAAERFYQYFLPVEFGGLTTSFHIVPCGLTVQASRDFFTRTSQAFSGYPVCGFWFWLMSLDKNWAHRPFWDDPSLPWCPTKMTKGHHTYLSWKFMVWWGESVTHIVHLLKGPFFFVTEYPHLLMFWGL